MKMLRRTLGVLAVLLALGLAGPVQAQRLGGGKSMGQQSSQAGRKDAPAAVPAGGGADVAKPGPAGSPPPGGAAPARRGLGAVLGPLAAGLGLAWLAQSWGLGEAAAHVMTVVVLLALLLAFAAWLARRRTSGMAGGSAMAFQGLHPGARAAAVRSYRPESVGNDASARPFERKGLSWETTTSPGMAMDATHPGSPMVRLGSSPSGMRGWGVPAGFDTDGFLRAAKANFISLQAAWDGADLATLRAMMTDGMLAEIQLQLNERESHTGGPTNFTEVVMIQARLLGIEDLGADYMASVEFSGMIREDISAGPAPFREVWNMTKPKDGGHGWLVAGVQALG
jgi:predicted lipid-binding transport protein (Tim44 family)